MCIVNCDRGISINLYNHNCAVGQSYRQYTDCCSEWSWCVYVFRTSWLYAKLNAIYWSESRNISAGCYRKLAKWSCHSCAKSRNNCRFGWSDSPVLDIIRTKPGNEYNPNTLHHLVCGILRHTRTINPSVIFKDHDFSGPAKNDARFRNEKITEVRQRLRIHEKSQKTARLK